jgi:Vinculin family
MLDRVPIGQALRFVLVRRKNASISGWEISYKQVGCTDPRGPLLQVDLFKLEKARFDKIVGQWDETGNDIIVLAKHMCMIMMEMTDFTR